MSKVLLSCSSYKEIRKPLTHITPYTLVVIYPVQLKLRFIHEHFSIVPVAIEGEHLLTEVGYDTKLQSGQDPGEDDKHADELP